MRVEHIPEEEAFTRDVYAHFGLAYYLSEVLHADLCNLYAAAGFTERAQVSRPRLEEKLKWASEQTLGSLVQELLQFLPDEVQEDLKHALSVRNSLAHGFWFQRIHKMTSTNGMEELLQELQKDQQVFRTLDAKLTSLSTAKWRNLGITEDMEQAALAEAMAGTPMEPFPDRRYPSKQMQIINAWLIPHDRGTQTLILQSEDKYLWQLCDIGLGWSYIDGPKESWQQCKAVQKFLPTLVDARPSCTQPWNYKMYFASGALLWVRTDPKMPGIQHQWGIKRIASQTKK